MSGALILVISLVAALIGAGISTLLTRPDDFYEIEDFENFRNAMKADRDDD